MTKHVFYLLVVTAPVSCAIEDRKLVSVSDTLKLISIDGSITTTMGDL